MQRGREFHGVWRKSTYVNFLEHTVLGGGMEVRIQNSTLKFSTSQIVWKVKFKIYILFS